MAQSIQVKDRSSNSNLVVNADGSLNVLQVAPAAQNFYLFGIADTPGVVAANNFLSLFNPLGSGKTITIYGLGVVAWASAATTASVSMNVFRTTAASAGTLVAASTLPKFNTSQADSIADVRTGNPTVTTTGLSLQATPPAITSAGSGAGPQAAGTVAGAASFILAPGQGIVCRTASGDVDQLWNIRVFWAEA